MPSPTAPPTTTALAAANTAVPRARSPNAAASSRAHTRISDVAPPVCPLGNANGVVAADRPVHDGLPERGDQPGQPGTADGEHRRPRGAGHEADHGEQTRGDGDDRRRAEHGDGPDEPVPRRGQRVDRAVEVAVDPARGVVARVAHGEDRDDRRREHRHRRRGPAGPVGSSVRSARGTSPTVPKPAWSFRPVVHSM